MTVTTRVLALLGIGSLTVVSCIAIFLSAPLPAQDIQRIKYMPVNVVKPSSIDFQPQYIAYGRVMAQQAVTLRSKVSGEITYVHQNFEEGGSLTTDDLIVQTDNRRLTQELLKAKNQLIIARASYELEVAQQKVAAKELTLARQQALSPPTTDDSIRLRKPQLNQAKGELTIAQAQLALSQLDLEQSSLRSTGNYQVISREVYQGDYVTDGQILAQLADLSQFKIEVAVPFHIAKQLTLPQQVLVTDRSGLAVKGKISHVVSKLENLSQLQLVMVELPNEGMILGQFVKVTLPLSLHHHIIKVPLSAVHENKIWIVKQDNTLDSKSLDPIWVDNKSLYARNILAANEFIVDHRLVGVKVGDRVNISQDHSDLGESL